MMDGTVPFGQRGMSVSVGDHVCAFYRTSVGRDEILVPYLQAGMERGDKCIAVLDQVDPGDIRSKIEAESYSATTHPDDQLEILCSEDSYLRGGNFSKLAMLDFWDTAVGDSIKERKYQFVRSVGEMTWALRQVPGVEYLLEYEAELNTFLPKYPQVILCLYDLDQFDGRVVVDLLRTHPKILLCGTLLDNPYYLEPREFLANRVPTPA